MYLPYYYCICTYCTTTVYVLAVLLVYCICTYCTTTVYVLTVLLLYMYLPYYYCICTAVYNSSSHLYTAGRTACTYHGMYAAVALSYTKDFCMTTAVWFRGIESFCFFSLCLECVYVSFTYVCMCICAYAILLEHSRI
jgi:hypothetical protein